MQFNKSRVYTALNADELKEGSKVILADRLSELKRCVKENAKPEILAKIKVEQAIYRFTCNLPSGGINEFALAYLIAPPAEPQYKPFPDNETALRIIAKHGGWIKNAEGLWIITNLIISNEVEGGIYVRDGWHSAKFVLNNFTFADDGSPVGVKVDDDADNDTGED